MSRWPSMPWLDWKVMRSARLRGNRLAGPGPALGPSLCSSIVLSDGLSSLDGAVAEKKHCRRLQIWPVGFCLNRAASFCCCSWFR
jgi:hypothetical protein